MSENASEKESSNRDRNRRSNEKRSGQRSSEQRILYKKNLEIYPEKRLPRYDTGPLKAYAATGINDLSGDFFVLVCEPHLIARNKLVLNYSSLENPGLAPFVDTGTVYWPPDKKERQIFIYKDSLGRKILEEDAVPALGWRQDDVMDIAVLPLVNILQTFRDRDFVHGSIRPTNMYSAESLDNIKKITLGDCLALPPSYAQPVLYETIPRGLTDPIARGLGTRADDIYAFGVSLAVMLRTNDPLEGMSDEQIIRQKIEQGTYSTVTGKDRFKGSILELLRGVLHDDESQRWSLDEIMAWMDGRRLSPKQSTRQRKAPRPITFLGKQYFTVPFLLARMAANVPEAVRLVEDDALYQWLKRALGDDALAEKCEAVTERFLNEGKGANYKDELIALLSLNLDTNAPIRYKNKRLMADGFGYAFAESLALEKDYTPFIELFKNSIVPDWVVSNPDRNIDIGALLDKFENCKSYMRQTKIGFGFERCLYSLCPDVHCLSLVLKNYCVRNPEEFIKALDNLCEQNKAPSNFVDRHSAAFLMVSDSRVIDSYLYELDAQEKYRNTLGTLKCLAAIQKRYELGNFPALALAIEKLLVPIYDRFHDRGVRQKIQKEVSKHAQTGSLAKMLELLDNPNIQAKDHNAFLNAMVEYKALVYEEADLDKRLENKNTFAQSTGRTFAAFVSCGISGIIILALSFIFFGGKAPFF